MAIIFIGHRSRRCGLQPPNRDPQTAQTASITCIWIRGLNERLRVQSIDQYSFTGIYSMSERRPRTI